MSRSSAGQFEPGLIEPAAREPHGRPNLDGHRSLLGAIAFLGAITAALLYVGYSIFADVEASGVKTATWLPYILLFVALVIALGFEFVNGFHDTALSLIHI